MPGPRDGRKDVPETPATSTEQPARRALGPVALAVVTAAYVAVLEVGPDSWVHGTGPVPLAFDLFPVAVAVVVAWRLECSRPGRVTRRGDGRRS